MAMLLARMRPAATGVMRRSFSTAPATMSESAVAAKAGAGEIAPLAVPMSYGLGELAIMPMTMAANNMALGMSLARWGVAGGLFLYMLIRPKEWSQVRSLDVTVSRFCAARERVGEWPEHLGAHVHLCPGLCPLLAGCSRAQPSPARWWCVAG